MTTAELLQGVRDLTEAAVKDYPDAQIQNYIDQEYLLWQQKASEDDSIQWSSGDLPDVLDVVMATNTEIIPQNMNIIRVEAEIDGEWVVLHKTNTEDYGGPERSHESWCTCNFVGSCSHCRSFTEALAKEGSPHYYVQSNAAIQVFPFPATGTQNIKIYYEGIHILNWVGGDSPRLPLFAHPILQYQAALMYKDIKDTGTLAFILSERTRLSNELEATFAGKTKIRKMHFTKKSYL